MSYGIVSDLHFHNWSAFSSTDQKGMNTRLGLLIKELHRAAKEIRDAGGDTLFVAGDVFHVRGQIAPSVLNPVIEAFAEISKTLKVYILAGNHDLEGRNSNWLGSAVSALESPSVKTISDEEQVVSVGSASVGLIPWQDDLSRLKVKIIGLKDEVDDLIIHAPMNRVIKGIPDTGLDPDWLATLGYRNIYSGHYHNHKCFHDRVFSIGALAHHTWSDVGSKAGFILVSDSGEAAFRASHCPEFVEIDHGMSESDMALTADGNYVRVRLATSNLADVQEVREFLIEVGALGVNVIAEPARSTVSRAATSVKKGMTTAESVASYIDPTGTDASRAAVRDLCMDILKEAESV